MNRLVLVAIAIVAVIVGIAAVVIIVASDETGNMSNPDVQNVQTQDIDNTTENPDPVKESGTSNGDTTPSNTGTGQGSDNMLQDAN